MASPRAPFAQIRSDVARDIAQAFRTQADAWLGAADKSTHATIKTMLNERATLLHAMAALIDDVNRDNARG